MLLYLLLSILFSTESLTNPSCKWQRGPGEKMYQTVGMCSYTSQLPQLGSPVYIKFDCVSPDSLSWSLYSDSDCTTAGYTAFFNHSNYDFNCSDNLPTCTDNIAQYHYYYDDTNCTLYDEYYYLIFDDACLRGSAAYFKAYIYNDSTSGTGFHGEILDFHDEDCVSEDHCDTFKERLGDGGQHLCNIEQPLVSYSGTPNTDAACVPDQCADQIPGGSFDCSWINTNSENCQFTAIGICDINRIGGNCLDAQYKCSDDGSSVSAYWYDSGDRSCSGEVLVEFYITNDSSTFDCSLPTCENVLKFKRFEIPDCGLKNCSTPGCRLDEEDYFHYNYIVDSCPVGFDSGFCDLNNNGIYPDNTELHGQYFEEIGCFANSTTDERQSCTVDSTPSPIPAINIDINCNWAHSGDWVNAVGICVTGRFDGFTADNHLICNAQNTAVNKKYYDTSDGSCSGNVVYEYEVTADSNLFECTKSVCTEDIVTFKRYDNCSIDISDYSTYNMITNYCIYDFDDNTNYKATCDTESDEAWRYGYDASDTTCTGVQASTNLNEDLQACVDDEFDNYFTLVNCLEPTMEPTSSPVTVQPSKTPTSNPVTSAPTEDISLSTMSVSAFDESEVEGDDGVVDGDSAIMNSIKISVIAVIFFIFCV